MDDVFGSDEEDGGVLAPAAAKNRTSSHTSYPGVADGDLMLWSKWDESRDHGDSSLARRLLFLGYSMGLQIWDCSSLGSVSEILNLSGSDWGRIVFAGVLHAPSLSKVDPFMSQRLLMGMV
jgi:hypothetical protein